MSYIYQHCHSSFSDIFNKTRDQIFSDITNLNINHQMFLVQFDEKCRNINIIIIIQQIGEVGAQCTLQNGVLAWCHNKSLKTRCVRTTRMSLRKWRGHKNVLYNFTSKLHSVSCEDSTLYNTRW